MSTPPLAPLERVSWLTPERILGGAVLVCLLAFWVTIPLPRIDNQLLGSDGTYYYVYLPSALLDGDLDFTDEYRYFFAYDTDTLAFSLQRLRADGLPANHHTIGTALLWAPFFLLAHLIALVLQGLGVGVAANGYGYLYQAVVLSGSILYGGAGMWLAFRFAKALTSEHAALIATVLVVFSGNLVYYLTAEPFMSHTASAFLSGLLCVAWLHRRDRPGPTTAALYGLIAGTMALVRPQDGLLLVLPFLDRLPAVWHDLRHRRGMHRLVRLLRDGLVAAGVALAVFSPQLVVWDLLFGTAQNTPYLADPERDFSWTSPHLFQVLFSPQRGLFVWHPVFLAAVIGLVVGRKARRLAWLALLGFAIQLYVVSSWYGWVQGEAFGGRMFIVCTPFFTLGLARLLAGAARRWSWRTIYALGLLLLLWNFLLFVEYRFDLALADQYPTWYDVTIRRITFLFERLL